MKLHFLQCVPEDRMFHSELIIQLLNFRQMGYSHLMRILVYIPKIRMHEHLRPDWKWLEEQFPEVKFFYYTDPGYMGNIMRRINYVPLLRPYCLKEHFKEFPELGEDSIFYHDSDVLFIKPLDFSAFLEDDIHYLSYTGNRYTSYNYICADHFDDKMRNVRPEHVDAYKEVLPTFLSYFKLTEKYFRDNKDSVGGAQYLLKNVDHKFWQAVYEACVDQKPYLGAINQAFMKGDNPQEREDNGVQSWCMDMWAVLFTLWKRGDKTLCPKELDFLWATDSIEKWEQDYYIFHNAGMGEGIFNKRAYHDNTRTPFQDDLSWVAKQNCSYKYVEAIQSAKHTFNL